MIEADLKQFQSKTNEQSTAGDDPPESKSPQTPNKAKRIVVKPLLTVEQQIAHMKHKGIAFELTSEKEAVRHLRTKCHFFRLYAYRKLIPKYTEGARSGQYIGLDFEHLKALSNLDRRLRDTLLSMTLDMEHFAKTQLLSAAEDADEDGYSLITDYFRCLPESRRSHIQRELHQRRNDSYAGNLICTYENRMPLWVFCEVVSFGVFIDLLRFCSKRWNDSNLADAHYLYKNIKQVRNASAHGACILNDIASKNTPTRPPATLVNVMNSHGIPKRLRTKWLRSRRMAQICSLIYLYSITVPIGSCRSARSKALIELFEEARTSGLPHANPAISALQFMRRLTDSVGLLN